MRKKKKITYEIVLKRSDLRESNERERERICEQIDPSDSREIFVRMYADSAIIYHRLR